MGAHEEHQLSDKNESLKKNGSLRKNVVKPPPFLKSDKIIIWMSENYFGPC